MRMTSVISKPGVSFNRYTDRYLGSSVACLKKYDQNRRSTTKESYDKGEIRDRNNDVFPLAHLAFRTLLRSLSSRSDLFQKNGWGFDVGAKSLFRLRPRRLITGHVFMILAF